MDERCKRCRKEFKLSDDVDKTGQYHVACAPVNLPVGDPVINPLTGKSVSVVKPVVRLDNKQKISIFSIAVGLNLQNLAMTSQSVYNGWPTKGIQAKLAGDRPSLNQIHLFMDTDEYIEGMEKRGVSANKETLSAEQLAFLQVLTSTKGGSLSAKLQKSGIKDSVWRAWLRQKAFAEAYRNLAGDTLRDAIPAAKVALAANASNGDLASIKYLNELTGEYRPGSDTSSADAQKMVQVVLNAIMNNVSDTDVLRSIQRDIQFQTDALNSTISIGA